MGNNIMDLSFLTEDFTEDIKIAAFTKDTCEKMYIKSRGTDTSLYVDDDYYSVPKYRFKFQQEEEEKEKQHSESEFVKEIENSNDGNKKQLLPPREIKKQLSEHVIGQDNAKTVLAVAAYNHQLMIDSLSSDDDVELEKSNILLLGPTGSGKTFLAQTLAKILYVPFAIADATTLTEAGYGGEDVESILLRLIQAADYDIEKAEKGIIYIDEIDKIAKKASRNSKDPGGEGVQQALLKIIEGTIVNVYESKFKDPYKIDTKNILFICGGAFEGLDKTIRSSLCSTKNIGFGADVISRNKQNLEELYSNILPGHLIKYGLIPEFIGRLPVITYLHQLDINDLVDILTKPKNAIIKQYKKLFNMFNVELIFHDDALVAIAEKAIANNTGARGLRAILEKLLLKPKYKVPSDETIEKCIITKEVVEGKISPIYGFRL